MTAPVKARHYPQWAGNKHGLVDDQVAFPTYAQGVSHPDADGEQLTGRRDQMVDAGQDVSHVAPITRIAPAPVGTPLVPAPASRPVVQGFGGEVALPSPASQGYGVRHRYDLAGPPPVPVTAEPLEERETVTSLAVGPAVLAEPYDRDGHLVMPAPLYGSHDVLVHQNQRATSDGLERIYDDADLERLRAAHQLINFPAMEGLRISEDLPSNRRVARPWTVAFAADMAQAYYSRFHQSVQINSAVRTVRYQARLQLVNGNAAAISGDAASPHLTGQAIDFGKRGMSQAEIAWVRQYLLPFMQAGKIDVEEEFQQACFHISVYRSYVPLGRRTTSEYATMRSTGAGETPSATMPDQR